MSENQITPHLKRSHGTQKPPTAPVLDPTGSVVEDTPITPPCFSGQTKSENRCIDQQRPADIKQLVAVVSDAADVIQSALTEAYECDSSLYGNVRQWCDTHGIGVESDAAERIVARQAALNVLLKATLYEAHHKEEALPAFPSDPWDAFQTAREQTSESGFDTYVLDDVASVVSDEALAPAITARTRLLNSSQPAEDIGRLYESLLPAAHRQVLGQFRTPPEIASTLREWAVTDGDTVLDPGIGPAALPSRHIPGWTIAAEPATVIGIDRSPLSALMAAVTLTVSGQEHVTHQTDFFEVTSTLSSDVDAVVANPPYASYNDMPKPYRTQLNDRLEQLTGTNIPGKTPLYAYFLYYAGEFLDDGDRLATIIPHHILNRQYGTAFKRYLLEEFHVHAAVLLDPTTESVFETADTTALLLFLEATSDSPDGADTKLIEVTEPTHGSWHQAVPGVTPGETEWGRITVVDQDALAPQDNWFRTTTPPPVDTTNLTALSEVADVRRGVSTGDNEFYCLSQHEIEEFGIARRHVRPLIRYVSQINGSQYTDTDWEAQRQAGDDVWLLSIAVLDGVPNNLDEARTTREDWGPTRDESLDVAHCERGVQAYLREAIPHITSGELEESACWYRGERSDSAAIVMQTVARSGFNAVVNRTEAVQLNNGHGIHVDESMTLQEIKTLAAFLNSTTGSELLHHHAGIKSGGAYRLTPGMLGDVPVIDPRSLDTNVVERLAALFDDLTNETDEHHVVNRIDDIVETAVLQ